MFFYCVAHIFAVWIFGYGITNVLVSHVLDKFTCIALGGVVGIISAAWFFFVVTLYCEIGPSLALIQSVIFSAIGLLLNLIKNKHEKKPKMQSISSLVFSVAVPSLFLCLFLHYGVIYKNNLCRGAAFGDMPFHMNIISSFAYGCNKKRSSLFSLVTPFYSGHPLAYPFIPNYYSAVLLNCFNVSFHEAIVLPSFVFAFALFAILSRMTFIFTKSTACTIIAPILYIFLGGTGFLRYIALRKQSLFYTDFVYNLGEGVTGCWFHPIIHTLLPQRASLFSLPISWAFLLLLMESGNKFDPKLFLYIGFLIVLLPQVQAHSLIALLEYGVCYALLHFPIHSQQKLKNVFFNYLVMFVIGFTLAVPQVMPYISRTKSKSFVSFCPIWLPETLYKTPFTFWWNALGCFIVIALSSGILYLDNKQLLIYIPSLFVFFVSNFILYQPWNMDNNKVFNAGFIPLALVVVSNFFYQTYQRLHKVSLILLVPLFVGCCASGFLAIKMGVTEQYSLFSFDDHPRELADWVIQNTPTTATFVSHSWHANPISTLSGRQLFYGYDGWIYTHGLSMNTRPSILRKYQMFEKSIDEIDANNITHLFLKTGTQDPFPPRDIHWKLVYSNYSYKIFERRKK